MKGTPLPLTVSASMQHRLAGFVLLGRFQGIDDLPHVMAVDAHHLPAESLVFGGERLDVHHRLSLAVNLQMVVVEDGNEVVELVLRGLHGRLPDLPLLLLAVAHDAEDVV